MQGFVNFLQKRDSLYKFWMQMYIHNVYVCENIQEYEIHERWNYNAIRTQDLGCSMVFFREVIEIKDFFSVRDYCCFDVPFENQTLLRIRVFTDDFT